MHRVYTAMLRWDLLLYVILNLDFNNEDDFKIYNRRTVADAYLAYF